MGSEDKRESGAIVVEATISLSVFIFMMFTLLMMIDICLVQARISVAANAAAKELSQYAYLYTATGLDQHMTGEGGKSSELMQGVSKLLSKVGGMVENIDTDISNLFNESADAIEKESIAQNIKNLVGIGVMNKFLEKNLISFKGDDDNNYLNRMHVENLNLLGTSFLADLDGNGKCDDIRVVVTYEVQVIKLLNIDYKFRFVQKCSTKAWGDGISLMN